MRTILTKDNRIIEFLLTLGIAVIFVIPLQGIAQTAGNALDFDGVDDYVDCGSFLPASYTKEVWVNIPPTSNLNNNLISGSNTDGDHAFWCPSSNGLRVEAGHNQTWNYVRDPNTIPVGWVHYAVTYDANTREMKLYKNGVLIDQATNVPPFNSGNIVFIGNYKFGSINNVLKGQMDEVRIWNFARSETEIQANLHCELSGNETGLVAYYRFDEGNAGQNNSGITTLPDLSGNGHNGTLSGFALNGSSSNWVTSGANLNGICDNSLPVTLTSFGASAGDGQVTLSWVTESEVDNEAFILERSTDQENFNIIAEIPGQGNTNRRHDYRYTDKRLVNGITYFYRLSDRDINGIITNHQVVSATPSANGTGLPQKISLHQNYPNPFNPSTTIGFDLPVVSDGDHAVRLTVFNSLGQKVRTLINSTLAPGSYKIVWNGTNDQGEKMESGIYFYTLEAGSYQKTGKMLLAK